MNPRLLPSLQTILFSLMTLLGVFWEVGSGVQAQDSTGGNKEFLGPRLLNPQELIQSSNPTREHLYKTESKPGSTTDQPITDIPQNVRKQLTHPASSRTQTGSNKIIGGTWAQPDYWIISSQNAPQSWNEGGYGSLNYIHFDQRLLFVSQSKTDFQNWIDPEVPICFIIHGSFTTWESLRFESGLIYQWFKSSNNNQPLQLVFFHWPSAGPVTGFIVNDIERLGNRASYNAGYLKRVIKELPSETPLYLFGHSHGGRLAAQTFQELSLDSEWKQSRQEASANLILAQAALDHHWFRPGQQNGEVLPNVDRTLNLINSRDFALTVYPAQGPEGREALGRVGFTAEERLYLGSQMTKVKEFDLAPWIGTSHLWANLYKNQTIGKLVTDFIHQPDSAPKATTTGSLESSHVSREPFNNTVPKQFLQTGPSSANLYRVQRYTRMQTPYATRYPTRMKKW